MLFKAVEEYRKHMKLFFQWSQWL